MTQILLQRNLVIGFPLSHTKSPLLHNVLYKKLGINAVMSALPNKSVKASVAAIRKLNIGLAAVTMPHKQTIIKYLDEIDSAARKLGAVNTVINKGGVLKGYNTDIDGIASALQGVPIKGKTVLILGAGGAARAAAYYIKIKKGKLVYLNRTKSKAEKLKREFGGQAARNNTLMDVDVVINATPVGMYPKIKATPFPKKFLKKGQYVFDLVYNPAATKLIRDAKSKGAKTISGIEMFIGQALRQIELYLGKKVKSKTVKIIARKILIS